LVEEVYEFGKRRENKGKTIILCNHDESTSNFVKEMIPSILGDVAEDNEQKKAEKIQ
jgi:hypothetical protein